MLLRQMQFFLAAVACKSFSEAAKECFVSQPAFSLQIKQLEKELGVKLINRNNVSFTLTPAGEKFYPDCKKIAGEIQALVKEMQAYSEEYLPPQYIIGCKTSYNVRRLLSTINMLNRNTDNYHLKIIYGEYEELFDMLQNQEIQMVIAEERSNKAKNLDSELLYSEQLLACLPPIRGPIQPTSIELKELAKYCCVLVASKEYQEQEREYYRQLLDFNGSFIFSKDIASSVTSVIDSRLPAFMPVSSNSDASIFFGNFTRLLPILKDEQPLSIDYKIFWARSKKEGKIASIANHIVSLLQDH